MHLMLVIEGAFGYKSRLEFAEGLNQVECCVKLVWDLNEGERIT